MITLRDAAHIPPTVATLSNSALVLIDVQNEYNEGPVSIPAFAKTVPTIEKLLQRYRDAKAPVVHVAHKVGDNAPIFGTGTPGIEPWAATAPKDGEKLVWKQAPSGFVGTELDEVLKQTGKNVLVLVGYQTHNCVCYTAGDAVVKGYEVVVPRDCTAVRPLPGFEDADKMRDAYLAGLADMVATVVNSQDIQ